MGAWSPKAEQVAMAKYILDTTAVDNYLGDLKSKLQTSLAALHKGFQLLKSEGFKVDSVPKGNAVVVELPIKNNISYMIGPIQAYPAISKYMQAKGYKPKLSLEVYDVPVKKIYYIMQYSL